MTGIRSRRLAVVVALALLPVTGCGGDDTPARSAADRREAAADAVGSTLAGDGLATGSAFSGGSGNPSIPPPPPLDVSKPPPAQRAGGGTTTTALGAGSSTPGPAGPPGPDTTTTTTTPVAGCPDPRGCSNYKLLGGRWPRDANGVVTIHYRVKTAGHTPANTPPITPEQLVDVTRRAAQTWMDAVPTVRLVYGGTTTDAPNSSNNVIGWGATATIPGGAETRFMPGPAGPTYSGFSVYLYPAQSFSYRPCDPAQPCADDPPNFGYDLQGVLTHEWGHVLGLDHVENAATDTELTMNPGGQPNRRHMASLGLGDVLGARSLYPTNASMPVLYRP